MKKIFSSELHSKETKHKLYNIYLCSIAMPYSEIWSTTKGDETKLLIFGRKIFIKVQVLGAIFNTKTCQYEIITDSNI